MRRAFLLVVATIGVGGCTSEAQPSLVSGDYVFAHRFEEHPDIPSTELAVQIRGRQVTIINNGPTDVFPRGLIEQGTLIWHAKSGQWIIGTNAADANAADLGGCSDGPSIIDLQRKIYWTC